MEALDNLAQVATDQLAYTTDSSNLLQPPLTSRPISTKESSIVTSCTTTTMASVAADVLPAEELHDASGVYTGKFSDIILFPYAQYCKLKTQHEFSLTRIYVFESTQI